MCFCLMTSHYHLVVEVADEVLPRYMHALNLPYARNFNRRWGLRGHVQYNRYGSRRILDEDDLVGTYGYVVNNPVRAGRCGRAEEWLWSSYAGTLGLAPPHSFVDDAKILRCFGGPPVDPRAALRRRVEES